MCVNKYRPGQLIKIIDVDEFPEYSGKIGIITDVINGELYGTWGKCAILLNFDIIEVIE